MLYVLFDFDWVTERGFQIGFGDVNEICQGDESLENATYRAISGGGGGGGGATYVFLVGVKILRPCIFFTIRVIPDHQTR